MISFLMAVLVWNSSPALAEFQVPPLTGPVVDAGGMLSSGARTRIESYLRNLKERGGAQITVATVPSLEGLSIEEASIKIVDQWKLGGAQADNGVLILLAKQERKVRIEVGYGLEGVLPDVIASRIVREVMVPRFRSGDIGRGVMAGVLAVVHYTNPDLAEGRAGEAGTPVNTRHADVAIWIFLMLIMLFFAVIGSGARRRGRFLRNSGAWGGMGGLGGGGFGGGGFGGGGWSGGGGGFGGGGASGGW